ncbi:MAG: hypothetical protein LPK19_14340 [Hymenobacteraceae bacterium]|nr:hypothetical protein [Hymenobacteraceae bacterium]MDX5397410.1 hypothetical protein [Hymenobacteraceae bacterium]MDX5513488.1 hypothetical protein [Hymenobacteraceae bacterium]
MLALIVSVNYQALAGGDTKELLAEARELFQNFKDSEALQKYEELLQVDSLHYEALCKASLINSRIGSRYTDETRKIQFFSSAKEYAAKAYHLQPQDDESNYVMALAISNLAVVSGVKERIAVTRELKAHLDQALRDNPEHADAWHLLGRWHYKVANFNFAEVTAANLLFGGVPLGASNEKAIQAMQQALKYSPNNIQYYYDLARMYKSLKEKEACKNTLQCAVSLSLVTSEDLEVSRRCKNMLENMK